MNREKKPVFHMDTPTDGVDQLKQDPRKGGTFDDSGGFGLTFGDLLRQQVRKILQKDEG